MLYIIEYDGKVSVTDDHEQARKSKSNGLLVLSRHDFETFEQAESAAELANDRAGDEVIYIATDGGRGLWPRFDVQTIPQVGDFVSRGFNGDYYPVGTIVSVGAGKRMVVTTDNGSKFNRFRKTGTWKEINGGFSMVRGNIDKRNPSF